MKRKAEEIEFGDDDSVDEEESRSLTASTAGNGKFKYTNKQRVLIVASRGITARHRHLLEDLKKMIPHHKKDNKLDAKGDIHVVNEIAEMKSCNQIVYLETRKHQDLYMYVGNTPSGPSAKFHVVNVHTMDELKLTGNCMLGSRPLLNFDVKFDSSAHFKLMKALLTDAFSTPLGHPKSKPFVDHIISFFLVKNNIWIRNYQIVDKSESSSSQDTTNLVEIGPRMVLIPIRIFSGSLGGATLYQNPAFVTPNEERSATKKNKGDRFVNRAEQVAKRVEMVEANRPPVDELAGVRMFKEGK